MYRSINACGSSPSKSEIFKNSTNPSFLSPRSYLETKDWGWLSILATATWLNPFASLASLMTLPRTSFSTGKGEPTRIEAYGSLCGRTGNLISVITFAGTDKSMSSEPPIPPPTRNISNPPPKNNRPHLPIWIWIIAGVSLLCLCPCGLGAVNLLTQKSQDNETQASKNYSEAEDAKNEFNEYWEKQQKEEAQRKEKEKVQRELKALNDLRMKAWYESRKYVRKELKSPSSASFPLFDTVGREEGQLCFAVPNRHGAFKIESRFEAKNSFGTKLTSRYSVTMVTADNGKTWIAENIVIEETGGSSE